MEAEYNALQCRSWPQDQPTVSRSIMQQYSVEKWTLCLAVYKGAIRSAVTFTATARGDSALTNLHRTLHSQLLLPPSPFAGSILPYSESIQVTNLAENKFSNKKKEIALQQISDLDQLIMWWVPEHDPERGEDSGLKQKFSMLGSCGSLVWKATSLFRWVQL